MFDWLNDINKKDKTNHTLIIGRGGVGKVNSYVEKNKNNEVSDEKLASLNEKNILPLIKHLEHLEISYAADKPYLLFTEDIPFVITAFKNLENQEKIKEKLRDKITELTNSSDYPHNLKGQMVEDFKWVLSLFNEGY